jgi:hypothetical protein
MLDKLVQWAGMVAYHRLDKLWQRYVLYRSKVVVAGSELAWAQQTSTPDRGTFDGTIDGFRKCVRALRQASGLASLAARATAYSMLDAMAFDYASFATFGLDTVTMVVVNLGGVDLVRIDRRGGDLGTSTALVLDASRALCLSKHQGLEATDTKVAVGLMAGLVTLASAGVSVLALRR